jgi:hypothetical protein
MCFLLCGGRLSNKTECTGFLARTPIKPENKAVLDKQKVSARRACRGIELVLNLFVHPQAHDVLVHAPCTRRRGPRQSSHVRGDLWPHAVLGGQARAHSSSERPRPWRPAGCGPMPVVALRHGQVDYASALSLRSPQVEAFGGFARSSWGMRRHRRHARARWSCRRRLAGGSRR